MNTFLSFLEILAAEFSGVFTSILRSHVIWAASRLYSDPADPVDPVRLLF